VTNGDTCRCGTGLDAAALPLDTDANCNVNCTGRAYAQCGGSAATHIYTTCAAIIANNGTDSGNISTSSTATVS
jgi:hypothetical protein